MRDEQRPAVDANSRLVVPRADCPARAIIGTHMRAAALWALLAWAAATSAFAQAPKSVYLEDLTWTEVRDATAAGKTTIIVPIGGTEQSGPHIALGKHNVRVKILAGKIAAPLGNALAAPVVAYVPQRPTCPPPRHMRFPPPLSLP